MVGALVFATSAHPPEKSDPVSELGRWLNPPQVTQDRQVKLPAPMSASQLFSSSCFSQVAERAQCVCVCMLRMCENWRSDNARRLLCCCCRRSLTRAGGGEQGGNSADFDPSCHKCQAAILEECGSSMWS